MNYMIENNLEDVEDIVKDDSKDISEYKISYIPATPTLYGEDALSLIRDVMRKPTEKAMERNRKAQELVRKLRGV